MVNIYSSSIAKTVFVWICLVFLAIGFIWSIIACKFESKLTIGDDSIGIKIGKSIAKHGGTVLSCVSWFLLIIYELAWRPYRHLDDVPSEELNNLIDKYDKKD
jgi:hypothetical protein